MTVGFDDGLSLMLQMSVTKETEHIRKHEEVVAVLAILNGLYIYLW
jgi:hypothetical protein